jgi:DNA-binding HxlR family transcriptional regulator
MAAEPARVRSAEEAPPASGGEDQVPEASSRRPDPNPVELDRLIHGRVRLGIVSALAVHEVLSFTELKELLDTSDGNLSVHARRLEEGGYVSCKKSFVGRVPRTEYSLTNPGRRALARYLDHMEALIDRVREP